MKHKREIYGNKGITLVALVVTIIVLLILAGVSLNLVLGDNGIITRAQDAVTKYKEAEAEEQWQMDNFMMAYEDKVGFARSLQLQGFSVAITDNGFIAADTENDVLYRYNERRWFGVDGGVAILARRYF